MNSHRHSRSRYGLTLHIEEQGTGSKKDSNRHETVAEIGTEIRFDRSILNTFHYEGWRPVHHDLMMVCAAVEFADRRCGRRATRWSRQFQITLPVLEVAAWHQPEVQAPLQDTLRKLTGDDWHFVFVQAADRAAYGPRQLTLPFCNNKEFCHRLQ